MSDYALKIYEFNPELDIEGALAAARSLIRLPAPHVEEIVVAGYVPPAPEVELDGVPHPVEEIEYTLTPDSGVITRIKVGAKDPESRPYQALRRRSAEDAGDALILARG